MAQVTLLCEGLRRDPPDAWSSSTCQGLETPGAFAVDCPAHRKPPAQSRGP